MLQRYIRAKVILVGLSFLYCSIAMLVLGFPKAIALGIVAGILEFIPVVGWMTAAATLVTVGVLSHSHWIWMLALLGIWRISMDYGIAPRVMGHELEIHPLLAIFCFDGRRSGRWDCGDLSFRAAGRRVACYLPTVRLAPNGPVASQKFCRLSGDGKRNVPGRVRSECGYLGAGSHRNEYRFTGGTAGKFSRPVTCNRVQDGTSHARPFRLVRRCIQYHRHPLGRLRARYWVRRRMRQPLASLQRGNPSWHGPNANADRIHPQGNQRRFTGACGDSSNFVLAAHRNR